MWLYQELGVGQTWQNVTANRLIGMVYVNRTGRTIIAITSVRASTYNQALHVYPVVDGLILSHVSAWFPNSSGYVSVAFALVPNGSSYQFLSGQSDGVAPILEIWSELR